VLTRKDRETRINEDVELDPRRYRDAMACFAGAVHVVTTDGAAGRRGTTVIAACSVSDNPPTVLVCLNRLNERNDLFLDNGAFALNTLAGHHQALSSHFSGLTGLSQDDRFAHAEWDTIETGAPTLTDALAVFDCRLIEAKEVATHRIYIGRVTGLRIGDKESSLIYLDRGYHTIGR
jgi:cob(II)yrinic acid a,c-diamide reductase